MPCFALEFALEFAELTSGASDVRVESEWHACMCISALFFPSPTFLLSFSYASKSDAIRLSTDAILMQP